MFEILFGWRKASRCKKLIRQVQCRLKLSRNKRDSIIRQLRQDVVQLIKSGHQDCALSRVEQLYKDQNINAVYDLLDSICEFLIINLSYIRRHRDCPNDINEAVSSLLYASARCGDLPELIKLRVLFSERYGQKFALAAAELSHGNLVNRQMIENLCLKSIHDDLKLDLMKEIARDNGIRLNYPETYSEFELQDHEKSQLSIVNSDLKSIEHESNNSIPQYEKEAENRQTCFEVKSDVVGCLDIVDCRSDPVQKGSVSERSFEKLGSLHEAEIIASRSPRQSSSSAIVPLVSESPSPSSERSIVYLDDVEELEPSAKDVKDKDQRLFMFRPNIPLVQKDQTALTISSSGLHQEDRETFGPSDGKSSSRSSGRRRRSSRKGLKRRYVLVKNLSMKDVECALYYGKSDYSSSDDGLSHKSFSQRKHQRKMTSGECPGSYCKKISPPKSPCSYQLVMLDDGDVEELEKYAPSQKGKSSHRNCGDIYFTHGRALECSLDRPCYFITGDDKASNRFSRRSLQKGMCGEDLQNCNYSSDEAFSTNAKTIPKGFRSVTGKSTSKEMEEPEVIDCRRSCASSHDSSSRVTSPWTHARPPYLRAMTMPPERPKETPSYQMVRSVSHLPDQQSHSNLQSPSYVHPKLPEYDDLEAKFKALKKDQTFRRTYRIGEGLRIE